MRPRFLCSFDIDKGLCVVLPLIIIGVGIGMAMVGYISPGIIVMGAGIAILAFYKACSSIELEEVPVSTRERSNP